MPSPALFQFKSVAYGLAAILFLLAESATAQDAPDGVVSVQGVEIRIEGPITERVEESFIQQVRTHSGLKTVSLNSPGGRVFPALNIARAINSAGLNTSVPKGDECDSACSFIFLAGRERIADGLLGVHQVSGVDDPSLTQSAIGKIYEELVSFNTPSYLVSRMLGTPPGDMYIFTADELERFSINIRNSETSSEEVPHLPSEPPVIAQQDTEPWVVVDHLRGDAYSWNEAFTPRINAMETAADACGLKLFSDFAGKFLGFGQEGGELVVVDGYEGLSDAGAEDLLAAARPCFPDAYVKRMRYSGE